MPRPTITQLLAARRQLAKAEQTFRREELRFGRAQAARLDAMRAAIAAGMTLEQLGDEFGVSRQRVHQMLKSP